MKYGSGRKIDQSKNFLFSLIFPLQYPEDFLPLRELESGLIYALTMDPFAINRHDGYINGLFMDWSVRKIGLKELWRLKWHRKWDTNGWSGEWPEWMKNFKDY
jgi:prepilin-type processing-associated H-X9-DG protein